MARILVVDDEEQVRTLLLQMLEDVGYKVEVARSGFEAVKIHQKTPFDLIVTDIIMPDRGGLETIMDIRAKDPNVKIIAISGGLRSVPEGFLGYARRFGAQRTLEKPFSRQELLGAVEQLLAESPTKA